MAINSGRRSISFLVYGPLPPEGTNVLWMDSSDPTLPVLKIFWNGRWVPCHTDDSKEISLLVDVISELIDTNQELSNQILEKVNELSFDITNVAKEAQATLNKEAIIAAIPTIQQVQNGLAQQNTLTNGIEDLKQTVQNIDLSSITDSIGTPTDTSLYSTIFGKLADIKTSLPTIPSGLAQETSVSEGNDTAISVGKEVRSEVGTGSDTEAETGTLFAVVKWVKNKVKSIFDFIGTPGSGQPSTLFEAIAAGGSSGTVYPTIQMTETTAAIDPNKVYIWGEVASLDITLNAGEAGVANVYFLEFYSGVTPTTLTLPASVADVRGYVLPNKIINVGIYNGIAYIA